ncbi:unnamed protein product [Paramecium primaurelia]|uniref:Uncharacterized protein n=1 Tax=Paramecium primaurelia TaxID=5886 RepID=A0A8S1QLX3_PARPR|nr:unnamed protein product [Paramecium primaurelia]
MQNLKELEKCANSTNVFFRGYKIGGVRIGKWDYIMNGESMFGGDYNCSGQKVGIWIEPDKNYEKNLITFSGEYREDIKVGIWNTLLKEQIIEGGGQYNEKGQKQGMWIEVQNNTTSDFLLLYQGNYKEGRRVNNWKWTLDNETIGQGQYNDNGQKDKFWTEVDENYSKFQKFKFQGSYKNGMRIEKWLILHNEFITGGGVYSYEFKKNGIWVEPIENYTEYCPVFQKGTYTQDIKVGEWSVLLHNSTIGGGKYDKSGLKQGDWIDENYIGWIILKWNQNIIMEIQIRKLIIVIVNLNFNYQSQCMYNEIGEKQEYWIDFHKDYYQNEILFEGNYKKGKRYGLWNIQQQNIIIGNGLYDEYGQKFGLWKELHPLYSGMCELMMKGEYLNGVKINYWQIVTQKYNKLIGGGSFSEQGQKIGKWIEPHQCYSLYRQVISYGSYVDGLKIGIWEDIYLNKILNYYNFDKEGKRIKIQNQI